VFEVVLYIEETRRKYQTLILDIGQATLPNRFTIGIPADF
jgi:hypothetical protein